MIHVVVSIDFTKNEVYKMYLSTLMMSIADNTQCPVKAHIVYWGEFDERFATHLRTILKGYEFEIVFYTINIDDEFLRLSNIDMWSPVIVFKFYFPDILREIPKVIFLDLDIIVKRDISLLWDIDLHDNCVAGVQYINTDSINREYNSYEKEHSLSKRVNGGLVIMDLDKIRSRCNLLSVAKDFVKKYSDVKGIDEIVFNDEFFDSTLLLPSYCQHFLGMDGKKFDEEDMGVQNEIICMHYAFKSKPFNYVNGTPDFYFWKYFHMAYGLNMTEVYLRTYFQNVGSLKISLQNNNMYIRKFYEKVSNNKLYLFGAGVFAKKLFCYLKSKEVKIDGVFDNDPSKFESNFYGCSIQPFDSITVQKESIVLLVAIINDKNNEAVRRQLDSEGFREECNYFDSRKIFEDIREYETENYLWKN